MFVKNNPIFLFLAAIEGKNRKIVGVNAANLGCNCALDLLVGQLDLKGNDHVKNQIGVRLAADKTKIMDLQGFVYVFYGLQCFLSQVIDQAREQRAWRNLRQR